MRRKIHIFILFLFISSNLIAGKPKNKIKSKVYHLNKDTKGKEKTNIHPNNERPKRSIEIVDQNLRQKNKDITESGDPFRDPTKISQADKTRDRRGLSTENFSSYRGVSKAGQAKSYNHPYDIDRQQNGGQPFWDKHGSYTEDSGTMPYYEADVGVIKTEEPFRGSQRTTQENNSPLRFWGNRGRQVNYLIGNSGFAQYRRVDEYPSWGSRDQRDEYDTNWSKGSRRQEQSRKLRYLLSKGALNNKKDTTTFWKNRGRDSQIQHLFEQNQAGRNTASNTMLNNYLYADEPNYVIVERSSRSSGEEDPFVISRGKKKKANDLDWVRWRKAVRDRRGTIESIFKTVNADPFFIARGKKYDEDNDGKLRNLTIRFQDIVKVKELVCSTIELMNPENPRSKREVNRGDKNALKALAAQLQNDPYYVSRGKKDVNGKTEVDSLKEFIEEMAYLCN